MCIENGSLHEGSVGSVASGADGTKVIAYESLISLPDGDYDRDGDVDGSDWQQQYGCLLTLGSGANGNGDGSIDTADYSIWRDNYPAPSAIAADVVAEPAVAVVLSTLLVVTALSQQRSWGSPR